MKGIEKFNAAGGHKGWLSAAEFVAAGPAASEAQGGVQLRTVGAGSDRGRE